MGKTTIAWTDKTWNPVTGCSKVSQGCKYCYAERIFPRVYGKTRKFTDVFCHEDRLKQPLSWKKPCRIFVNSMSDLFHEDVPFEFIDKVFGAMVAAKHHIYQILTKRPARMLQYLKEIEDDDKDMHRWDDWSCALANSPCAVAEDWPQRYIWLGVSVEDQKTADERIPLLAQTPARIRFVSYEPALERVQFQWEGYGPYEYGHLTNISWVIVGGESGANARPFQLEFARDTIKQCKAAAVACFVKQMGSYAVDHYFAGYEWPTVLPERFSEPDYGFRIKFKDSHGGDWNEWPENLRVREYPSG